jgi:hypothetical protein
MKLLLNAFSANMLAGFPATVSFEEVSVGVARALLEGGFTSAVGHADTAAVFSSVLDTPVSMNRATLSLKSGDEAIVGQYIGPRMPEGTTTLPEGATIKWLVLRVA